jgi:hypothetical protein
MLMPPATEATEQQRTLLTADEVFPEALDKLQDCYQQANHHSPLGLTITAPTACTPAATHILEFGYIAAAPNKLQDCLPTSSTNTTTSGTPTSMHPQQHTKHTPALY